jgi:eukaryotic-like serine/threonine-protein kinase
MRVCRTCFKHHQDDIRVCDVDGAETARCPELMRDEDAPAGIFPPGTVIGNYRTLGLLGVGGMGLVYLGEHTMLRRMVALKLLRPELASSEVTRARFFAEARAANAVRHENIIEITDFIDEAPHRYFVMEVLEGETLQKRMGRGLLPLPRAVHIARQIVAAVHAAHEAGVIHRDLKPANVQLIRRGGDPDVVKVLDFGIAKLSGSVTVDEAKTMEGQVLGTPAYMAPEQPKQEPVDHRTDIYAFGALTYHVVTGQAPFTGAGNLANLIVKLLTEPPVKPNELLPPDHRIPAALEGLILKCMEKKPRDRPQSMAEVEDVLAQVAAVVGPAGPFEVSGSFEVSGPFAIAYSDPGLSPSIVETAPTQIIEREQPLGRPRRLQAAPLAAILSIAVLALVYGIVAFDAPEPEVEALAPLPPPAPDPVEDRPPRAPLVVPKVQVAFTSRPSGGQVFLAGEALPLGVTPFVREFAPEELPAPVEFRRDGAPPVREVITAERKFIEAIFTPLAASGKGKGKGKPRQLAPKAGGTDDARPTERPKALKQQLKRGALVDPFAED